MPYMTMRQIKHEMCLNTLRELGCKVVCIKGIMFYVKYELENLNIEYLYHINNDDNTYCLERIKPYFLPVGNFDTEKEVVDLIMIDIKQFINAKRSKNFDFFVEVDTEIFEAVRMFEDLYLYYNISKEDTELVKNEIKKTKKLMNNIKNRSERVFFEKDPETI